MTKGPGVGGRLAVVEEAAAFLVVWAAYPGDWLARFEKSQDFPAREWAENMVRVYNRRRAPIGDRLHTSSHSAGDCVYRKVKG